MSTKVTLIVLLVAALSQHVLSETQYIHEITDGPYQSYSAKPLVDLNGTFYFFESNLVANWYAAGEFCRKLGLFQVSLETAEENKLVVDYVKDIGAGSYWTSLTDLGMWNSYVWFSTGVRTLFFDWHAEQPSHTANLERSVQITTVGGVTKWDDFDPLVQAHIICERME